MGNKEQKAARKIGRLVEYRLGKLDRFVGNAFSQDPSQWMKLPNLPEDFVVYRYVNGSLQSWAHQFPLENDNLGKVESPLSFVPQKPVFMVLGFSEYILQSYQRDSVQIIAGLELKIPKNYTIAHLSSDAGSIVSARDIPLFKVLTSNSGHTSFLPGELSQIRLVIIINLLVFALSLLLYLFRSRIFRQPSKRGGRVIMYVAGSLVALCILVFVYLSILKVIIYTHINLSLFKFSSLTLSSAIVLLSIIAGTTAAPLVLSAFGIDCLKGLRKIASAAVSSIFISVLVFYIGFNKELQLAGAWAEGLSIERDMWLENQIRLAERHIAGDEFIAFASASTNAEDEIRRHVSDIFFQRLPLEYNIRVRLNADPSRLGLNDAVRISRESRFVHAPLQDARNRYVGTFLYFTPSAGMRSVTIIIEPKPEIRNRIFPGTFVPERAMASIPQNYSYAKYKGREREFFEGSYPYPTILTLETYEKLVGGESGYLVLDGFLHFACSLDDNEMVIISREAVSPYYVIISLILLGLIFYGLFVLLSLRSSKYPILGRSYFRRSISLVVMFSLVITLAALAIASVLFVNNRNEANIRVLMSDKVGSIRVMLQSGLRTIRTTSDLSSRYTLDLLRRVSENTSSDINLYAPDGKIIFSTAPSFYARSGVGRRMNERAYEEIIYEHRGYFIHNESYPTGGKFLTMYAPIFGSGGDLIAVFSSPYTETSFGFVDAALTHAVGIVTLFILLLLLSRFLTGLILNKIFEPLSQIGGKMAETDLNTLETIEYSRNDELANLVKSYNRMVLELSENTKALAQAERDKAWSGMARQVAHEIKNPLTPMKLQIQRIIRLKSQGDPSWQEKFDEVAGVILEHIDVLTQTANEFSTFAKLYTEDPVVFSLEKVVQGEIALFSSNPGLEIRLKCEKDVEIKGPKPQLTRVVFNILNNAVQACTQNGNGIVEVGLFAEQDKVLLSFEDNGPGVSEENEDKLFTPNFTTKTGGTGLGLAITRSVLDSCNARISYRRSEKLGGACFEIEYPL